MGSRFEPVITIKCFYSCLISIYLTTFWNQLVVTAFLSLIYKCNQIQVFSVYLLVDAFLAILCLTVFPGNTKRRNKRRKRRKYCRKNIFPFSMLIFFPPNSASVSRMKKAVLNWTKLFSYSLYKLMKTPHITLSLEIGIWKKTDIKLNFNQEQNDITGLTLTLG
jgi:hypothetical protein